MKIVPWKAGILLALLVIGIATSDYIGYLFFGPIPWYKFIFFLAGIGLIFYTIGQGMAWGWNGKQNSCKK
jgi:hypothetical protein